MKIAVTGKGGVGKSTVAAAIILHLAKNGQNVLALDADPDANLASALGIPSEEQAAIIPISEQLALIEERTGSKAGKYGQVFKLNPEVSDVADKFGYRWKDIVLLVLGAVTSGGSGCACPESTFIRSLVTDLVLFKNETLVMDMEAGVEHLGRATAAGVDGMIIVVEPGKRSVDCARSVLKMAGEIGISKFWLIGNKIMESGDISYLKDMLPDVDFAAFIPYSSRLRNSDRDGVSIADCIDEEMTVPFTQIYGIFEDLA